MDLTCDVLIVGAGLAGLNSAINLDKNLKIIILSNDKLHKCNSYLAQGGTGWLTTVGAGSTGASTCAASAAGSTIAGISITSGIHKQFQKGQLCQVTNGCLTMRLWIFQ